MKVTLFCIPLDLIIDLTSASSEPDPIITMLISFGRHSNTSMAHRIPFSSSSLPTNKIIFSLRFLSFFFGIEINNGTVRTSFFGNICLRYSDIISDGPRSEEHTSELQSQFHLLSLLL